MHRLDQRFQGLGIGLRYVGPDHDVELLLHSYFQRATMARKLDWNIPILHVVNGQVPPAQIKAWKQFYFSAEYPILASCLQTIAARCGNGGIELDPWDLLVWLATMPKQDAAQVKQILMQGGFIPANEKFTVVTLVSTQKPDISLRFSWTNAGYSRTSPHFLLRYFLHKNSGAAAEQLFHDTSAKARPKQTLWIEATRAILPMDNASDTASALVMLRQLVQGCRQFMRENDEQVVLFCEMPVWFASMANLKKFGDFSLLHGVDLLRVD